MLPSQPPSASRELWSRLHAQVTSLPVIDAHEHLPPEAERLAHPVSALTYLSQYTRLDLRNAGMSATEEALAFDESLGLQERWHIVEPYWKRIRHGSFARAVRLSLMRFHGVEDLEERELGRITDELRRAQTPGLYQRVLREACGIHKALSICQHLDQTMSTRSSPSDPILAPVMAAPYFFGDFPRERLHQPAFLPGRECHGFDQYLEAVEAYMVDMKSQGAVGLKIHARDLPPPDYEAARKDFDAMPSEATTYRPHLRGFVLDRCLRLAEKLGLTIAVHAGYWGDFRELHPLHLIPFLQRFPGLRFDVFHLGYPWPRETLMMAKGFPNVWINLCWTHLISARMTRKALNEALDLLPTNKLIGFGGDYRISVEKVWGHLTMARENLSAVLVDRVERGRLTEAEALALAKAWLWDNPKELYRLELE